MYQKKCYLQSDHIVDAYIRQSGQSFTAPQRLTLISLISMTVEHQFVDQLRKSFFYAAAKVGIPSLIHGANWWGTADASRLDGITLGPIIDPELCIRKMGRSKMVVNIQPAFTFGGHERVFNSMLNGAVCVSSRSQYLEAIFEDEKDILFIDFDHLDQTVHKMKEILENPTLLEQMRKNAYRKVKHKDTWKSRFYQIVCLADGAGV